MDERTIPTRATITEVARAAGVSTATVDRTLNNRAGVRARTRERVLDAAERLGYLPERRAVAPDEAAVVDIDFLLPGGTNTFLKILSHQCMALAEKRRDEARIRVHHIEGFDPDALAAGLAALKETSRAIGVIPLDHPTVREAIRDVAADGVPVLAMVSDISNVARIGYVGIDNRAAGRLAGHLLGRFIPPGGREVALFAGSLSYRGHEEREMGFRHMLAEEYPHLKVVELREMRDDSERAYAEAKTLLSAYGGLAGIYNIGGGNRGIARALEEAGRARDVAFVCHELTEFTRRLLIAGVADAVIDQNPRVEARDAVDWLIHAARGRPVPTYAPIRIQAIFKENIPQV
ncbi:MAG: LacI family DNA-binding transcriptional regulator [Bauldia sp.]|nr:LacI family DNA-binding transcriptional regulator [Bauldia sp.]MCB1495099.1 LacI family DNA-binding transcriptional regulator [Bauldia sp.]